LKTPSPPRPIPAQTEWISSGSPPIPGSPICSSGDKKSRKDAFLDIYRYVRTDYKH
jgi:hypothetical protein